MFKILFSFIFNNFITWIVLSIPLIRANTFAPMYQQAI